MEKIAHLLKVDSEIQNSISSALDRVVRVAEDHWAALLGTAVAAYCTNSYYKRWKQKKIVLARIERHQREVEEIRKELEEALNQGVDQDTPEGVSIVDSRKAILELPLRTLLFKLKKGDLKSKHVLQAYQTAALSATSSTNCVCYFLPDAAKRASDLDALPPNERGPLHGLPISIKECLHCAGHPSTAGISKFLDCPEAEDGAVVANLRRLGAVPFCKTNVGQCMKAHYSSNPTYGATTHPADMNRTSGGSTGGESALLALSGSPLGIGTDVGGSVRVPSAFCGTAAIKPTFGRICQRGRRTGAKGRIIGVTSNVGLMCPTADGLVTAMRSILEDNQAREAARLDHEVVPLPWNEVLYLRSRRSIKIGWYDTDGVLPVAPGCKRAVREAAALLEEAGHEVVPFTPPHMYDLHGMLYAHLSADDAGANTLALMHDEVWDETIAGTHRVIWQTPWTIKRLFIKSFFNLTGRRVFGQFQNYDQFPVRSKDLWLSIEKMHDYTQDVIDALNKEDIDILLAPTFPCPAPTLKDAKDILAGCALTAVYNVLDFPTGTVRVTEENDSDQRELEDFPENDRLFRAIKESTRGGVGLPLNVQVIGRPWQEELVLGIMREIENRREEENQYSILK